VDQKSFSNPCFFQVQEVKINHKTTCLNQLCFSCRVSVACGPEGLKSSNGFLNKKAQEKTYFFKKQAQEFFLKKSLVK